MDHISDPIMRVISKLGGPAVDVALEKERCAWAWGRYQETGEMKFLASFDFFAERWQLAGGKAQNFSTNINKLKAMGLV